MDRPGEINEDDDEFDTYRKRMMMAYRFRPNPLVRDTNLEQEDDCKTQDMILNSPTNTAILYWSLCCIE